jgi:hypothetical protein
MGTQLASLPVDPADRPLRALQVQLLAALSRHEPTPAPPGKSPAFIPSTMSPDQVVVHEMRDSEWAAASELFQTGTGQPR